jgi:hypothetical protein
MMKASFQIRFEHRGRRHRSARWFVGVRPSPAAATLANADAASPLVPRDISHRCARGRARSFSPGVEAGVSSNLKLETSNSSERGVALVITLILLSVITFMAIAFLVISRHASEAVTSVTQQAVAKQAAYGAVQQVEASVIASMLAKNEGFDFGPMVSQNYQSPAFTNGSTNVANVNYFVDDSHNPLTPAEYLQMLNNLLVLPRPPVFVTTNQGFQPDFRFYLDLNRNGIDDPITTNNPITGIQPMTVVDQFGQLEQVTAGDPEWIGVLEQPDQPHSRSNKFVARYAFFAQPIGNSLDINFIHNQVKQLGNNVDGFLRNQGVGSWEINLAGFLNGLNPNYWGYGNGFPPSNPNYVGLDTNMPPTGTYNSSRGTAFQDAASILQYRYNGGYFFNLPSFSFLYPFPAIALSPPNLNSNYIDYYGGGPLMNSESAVPLAENFNANWSGAGNANQLFTSQDFFNPLGSTFLGNFPGHVFNAGENAGLPAIPLGDTNFNRYTYYRMLSQMGMESAPEPDTKLNLNYINIGGYAASNFIPWTNGLIEFPRGSGNLTSGPLVFFTNAANRLLGTQTNFIIPLPWQVPGPTGKLVTVMTNLSTAFIPIYPTNYYTPAVHRMLQLAANIYDAANPKVVTDATNFDYPSVFRPVFGANFNSLGTNIWIKGYVEVTDTGSPNTTNDYNFPTFSLSVPADVTAIRVNAEVSRENFNVYGIPWVIGAKKGLPNFNQIALQSFTGLTRKLQIVKGANIGTASDTADRASWHTNVQYVLSISNSIMVEAWNSYASTYPRAVDILANDTLAMTLANEKGTILPTPVPPASYSTNVSFIFPPLPITPTTFPTVATNAWAGIGLNISSNEQPSFRFPILSTNIFLQSGIYSTNTAGFGSFTIVPNALTTGFNTTTGYPLPQFQYSLTNRLHFAMLDAVTGRVIDYVQLEGMNAQRSLTSAGELEGNDDWGPGGVWDTNREPPLSGNINSPMNGIENQVSASQQAPTPQFKNAGYSTPVTTADWNQAVTQTMGFNSVSAAAYSFNAFYNGETNINNLTYMQVPFTPTRTVCVYYTWQANDPLVHYTVPELTDLIDSSNGVVTNWVFADKILANLGQINQRYNPWGGGLNGGNPDYNNNLTLMDPLMQNSDAWQFPTNHLPNIGWLGRVHRGTPWQTVYMKSPPTDNALWQKWTGDASFFPGSNLANLSSDSFISQPTNDWAIFDLFTTAPNDNATRGQLSINQPNYAAWAALLDGVIALTNSPTSGFAPVVIDPNATNGAVFSIISSIANARANCPSNVFTRVGDILAAPALSITSPFLDIGDVNNPTQLNDAAYERLPQQIMSLLRVGQPRYVIYAYGQALKPADRSIVSGGPFYGTCTNYQITGEVVTRTVVRFEPATTPSPTDPYTPFNPTQNPVMPQFFPLPTAPGGGVPLPRPPMRAVVESFTVLPPE